MKCKNCGYENIQSAKFCSNCGNKQQKNGNKKVIIISFCVLIFIIALVCIIVNLVKKSNSFEDPFESVDDIVSNNSLISIEKYDNTESILHALNKSYEENKITADEYIMQLAYSIYDREMLDDKYSDMEVGLFEPNQLFEKAVELVDSLSPSTALYITKKYFLGDVKWDVGTQNATTGVSNKLVNNYKLIKTNTEETDLGKLDNVVLSTNGNFLIYYTKDGKNAITDDMANKISNFLEECVSSYKNMYGLDYEYSAQLQDNPYGELVETLTFGAMAQATTTAQNLLKSKGIDISYMESAMPVYIIDTDVENTGALGFYVKPIDLSPVVIKAYQLMSEANVNVDSVATTYSFPFFVVSSTIDDFENMKLVLAHELFHHYQKYICGNGNYGECISGQFTSETTANLVASKIQVNKKTSSVLNGHAMAYVKNVSSSIDKVGYGYASFVFANNYADNVINGTNHLFNSLKSSTPLKYLYDNSGGKYKDVLLITAEKNLTLDYDNVSLIPSVDYFEYKPSNYLELENVNIVKDITINYSSMQYFYMNPDNYERTTQISFNANSTDLSLMLFVKESGTYKLLHTHTFNNEFTVNINDFNYYDEIAFCIVNSSIENTISYNIDLNINGTKDVTVGSESLNITTLEDIINETSSFVCYDIETDGEYITIQQIKLDFNTDNQLIDCYFKGTIKMINYDKDNPAFFIAKKAASGLLYVMKKSYKDKLKYVDIITSEEDDKYSVTFKITKDYYEALKNSFDLEGQSKEELIMNIRKEMGFTCEYR